MIIKIPSIQPGLPPITQAGTSSENHYESPALRALRWFWRFSKFYGEYSVRSPQAQQQWLAERLSEQRAKHQ